jgi:hypothetical protein
MQREKKRAANPLMLDRFAALSAQPLENPKPISRHLTFSEIRANFSAQHKYESFRSEKKRVGSYAKPTRSLFDSNRWKNP